MDKVLDRTTGFHFTIIDNYILDAEQLNGMEQITYIHLKKYASSKDNCFPGVETLSKKLKCSKNSARNYVQILEKKGFIKIDYRIGQSNEYTLLPYPEYLEEQKTQKQVGGTKQKGIGDVFETYQNNINPVYGSMERDELIKWFETFENNADILLKAVEVAVYDNVRKMKYINKLLIDWNDNGIKTLDQLEAYIKQREDKFKKGAKGDGSTRQNTRTGTSGNYDFSRIRG